MKIVREGILLALAADERNEWRSGSVTLSLSGVMPPVCFPITGAEARELEDAVLRLGRPPRIRVTFDVEDGAS